MLSLSTYFGTAASQFCPADCLTAAPRGSSNKHVCARSAANKAHGAYSRCCSNLCNTVRLLRSAVCTFALFRLWQLRVNASCALPASQQPYCTPRIDLWLADAGHGALAALQKPFKQRRKGTVLVQSNACSVSSRGFAILLRRTSTVPKNSARRLAVPWYQHEVILS